MPIWAYILVASFAPAATVAVAFISLRRGQREIHLLVNNRLTEALDEIRRLGGDDRKF